MPDTERMKADIGRQLEEVQKHASGPLEFLIYTFSGSSGICSRQPEVRVVIGDHETGSNRSYNPLARGYGYPSFEAFAMEVGQYMVERGLTKMNLSDPNLTIF